jgi:hypothetical protein
MPAIHVRKYNTAAGTGTKIGMQHTKFGASDFATGSDWTPAAGDVKVSIDEGAEANIGTLPTYTNGWWIYTFTGGETTGKSIRVKIVDAATKVINDDYFEIETDGNASAMWPPDYANATSLGLVNLDATVSSRSTYAGGAVASVTGNVGGNVVGSVGSVTGAVGSVTGNVGGNVTGSVGSISGITFPTNFSSLIVLNGRVVTELSVHNGTAQAGGASTITLAAGASATNNFVGYLNRQILITGGTGQGQTNVITAYVGATKVATVRNAWTTPPDNTSTYSIEAYSTVVTGQMSALVGMP